MENSKNLEAIQKELADIGFDIRKTYEKLKSAREANEKYLKKKEEFFEIFTEEKKGRYIVGGLLCILVLIFDYWVSHNTLEYLAEIIRIPREALALLFSLVDALLAIFASGGLAGANSRRKAIHRKAGLPILILLGAVKILLFIFLVINRYTEIDPITQQEIYILSFFDTLKIIGPQVLFVAIVYSILGLMGFGLWYILGIILYWVYKELLSKPLDYELKLQKLFHYFKENAKDEFEQSLKEQKLEEIYNEIINKENKQ
jgi:hypothetical protein